MSARPSHVVMGGARPLVGRVRVPGCKGMSHRALLFAAIADGVSRMTHLAPGADVRRTRRAIGLLGVRTRRTGSADGDDEALEVLGTGFDGLQEPSGVIGCGNSATTARMLLGLLGGRPFLSVLEGDRSLGERPMTRVVQPLRALGAWIDGRDSASHLPLAIRGGPLRGARIELGVASGQVKTALVLAGLQASGTTEIVEPGPSRDHTERMLTALGAPLEVLDDRTVRVHAGAPNPFELDVPGDPSSAAFLLAGAAITPGSDLVIEDLLLNPGRIAFLDTLAAMGAAVRIEPAGERLGEQTGDVSITSGPLSGTVVDCHEAIIDEVPALAIAAAFAEGVTEFRGAGEMRVKETDRIATLEAELTKLGVGVESTADGLLVHGGTPHAAHLTSHGDHRIALAAAIAGNAIDGETTIDGFGAADVSYPDFLFDLDRLTGRSG